MGSEKFFFNRTSHSITLSIYLNAKRIVVWE